MKPSSDYGFILCAHDDPERSHFYDPSASQWFMRGRGLGFGEASLSYQKPVTIPAGYELVPKGEAAQVGDRFLSNGEWHEAVQSVGVIAGCSSSTANAYIRPITVNSDKSSVDNRTKCPVNCPVDWSKPIQTRGGKKARLVGEIESDSYPMVVAFQENDGGEDAQVVTRNGIFLPPIGEGDRDIINVPANRIKRECWINVYEQGTGTHGTRDSADDEAGYRTSKRLACVKVTIDCAEGEGL